jgi:hypothetical protein
MAQKTNIRFAMMLSRIEDQILEGLAKREGISKASVVRKLLRASAWVKPVSKR